MERGYCLNRTPIADGDAGQNPMHRDDLSHVFAGQNVGVTEVGDHLWLVTFMHYDLGYFDDETGRLEPIENPFGPRVLPMCSV